MSLKLNECKTQLLLASNSKSVNGSVTTRESLDATLMNSYFDIFDKTLRLYRSNTYKDGKKVDYEPKSPENTRVNKNASQSDMSPSTNFDRMSR